VGAEHEATQYRKLPAVDRLVQHPALAARERVPPALLVEIAREVLAAQSGLRAPGADLSHPQRPLRDHRQRERGPQDLPATLAERSVDPYPFTHTICRSSCATSTRSACASITLSIGL